MIDETSAYAQFDVMVWQENGSKTPTPDVVVKVYDATLGAHLDDVASDGDGVVAAGTLPVAVGTVIRFRVEGYNGLAGCLEQVTTEVV